MSTSLHESELSRPVKAKGLKDEAYLVEATPEELQALAERFSLSSLAFLRAEISLTPDGNAIVATGRMEAKWLQACSISGEDFKASAKEPLQFRFVPPRKVVPDEEIELAAEELDDIEFEGDSFDLGEAVAQSLGLAIDPFATGPKADAARKEKGIVKEGEQDGPMAEMLAALKKD